MKKAITIFAIFTMLFLSGCDAHKTEIIQHEESRLIVIDESMSYRIYVDKETKVMYLSTKQGYGEALYVCVMVDTNGKPLLWRGEEK